MGNPTRNGPSVDNSIYILLTLKKYSDKKHPITVPELTKHLNQDFPPTHIADNDKDITDKTVGRILAIMAEDIKLKNVGLPFEVGCMMKDPVFGFIDYRDFGNQKSPTRYYYYESVFSNEEITMLCDAMETYNYFERKDITDLYKKMASLRREEGEGADAPKYHSQSYDAQIKNPASSTVNVLENVQMIGEIIRKKFLMEIEYCNYGLVGGKIGLIPRNGGNKSLYLPLKLLWSNGYYYVTALGSFGNALINLRVDRINNIVEIEPDENEYKDRINKIDDTQAGALQSKSVYRATNPIMFGGKPIPINLLIRTTEKNGIMNAVVDIFGRGIRIHKASNNDFQKLNGMPAPLGSEKETWYKVRVSATPGGVELAATQYCNSMFVLDPPELRDRIRDRIVIGAHAYGII